MVFFPFATVAVLLGRFLWFSQKASDSVIQHPLNSLNIGYFPACIIKALFLNIFIMYITTSIKYEGDILLTFANCFVSINYFTLLPSCH